MGNLIRKNNQVAVTAYQDSVFLHFIKGISGVFPKVYNQFSYTKSNNIFTLNSGMGMIYGRQFELEKGLTQSFDLSALTGTKYVLIYAEIDTRDLSNQTLSFKALEQSLSYPSVLSDDLIQNEQGVARMPMYRFIYTSGATSPITDIETLFKLLIPDTVEYAKEAFSLPETSKIREKLVSNIISDDATKNAVKLSENTEKINGVEIKSDLTVNNFSLARRAEIYNYSNITLVKNNLSSAGRSLSTNPQLNVFTVHLRIGNNTSNDSTLTNKYNNAEFFQDVIIFKPGEITKTKVYEDALDRALYQITISKQISDSTIGYFVEIKNISILSEYYYIKLDCRVYGEVF